MHDFYPSLSILIKPLHDRISLKKPAWTALHTNIVRQVKSHIKSLPCLYIAHPYAYKIVETDASDLGYGVILKQLHEGKEQIISFTSKY